MAGEFFTGCRSERLDPVQIIVREHNRSVSHISGQQGKFSLDLSALPVRAVSEETGSFCWARAHR